MVGGLLSNCSSWLLGRSGELNAAPNSAVKRLNFDEVADSDSDQPISHDLEDNEHLATMAVTKKKTSKKSSKDKVTSIQGRVASTKKPSRVNDKKKKKYIHVTQTSDTESSYSSSDNEEEDEQVGVTNEDQDEDDEERDEDDGELMDDREKDDDGLSSASPRVDVTSSKYAHTQLMETPAPTRKTPNLVKLIGSLTPGKPVPQAIENRIRDLEHAFQRAKEDRAEIFALKRRLAEYEKREHVMSMAKKAKRGVITPEQKQMLSEAATAVQKVFCRSVKFPTVGWQNWSEDETSAAGMILPSLRFHPNATMADKRHIWEGLIAPAMTRMMTQCRNKITQPMRTTFFGTYVCV
jgi:hypothetical protein